MVDEPNNKMVTIQDLYPGYTEEQLSEAEREWEEYLEVVTEIYKRILSDPEATCRMRELLKRQKDEEAA